MDDTEGIFSRPERLLSCWSDWMPFVQLEGMFFWWTCQIQLVLISVNDVWSSLWGPEPLRCSAGTQPTGEVCSRLSSQGQPWNSHSMCPWGGWSLSVVSEYSWRSPLLTPKPSHLSVKHSHFQQWKITDVSRVASANRSHFPQNPIPASSRGCHRDSVAWAGQLILSGTAPWKPPLHSPPLPKRKDAGMAAKRLQERFQEEAVTPCP